MPLISETKGGLGILLVLLFVDAIIIRRRTAELAQEAAENVRSREAYRVLAGQLQLMQEEERARIAREIHDELGQQITAIKIDLSVAILEPRPTIHKFNELGRGCLFWAMA